MLNTLNSDIEIMEIEAWVKKKSFDFPYHTHHFDHTLRVKKVCLDINESENANHLILVISALLHDLGRLYDDPNGEHEIISAIKAKELLTGRNWPEDLTRQVCSNVKEHRFSKGINPTSLESKILQDADKIDALGAIGIVRIIAHDTKMHLYDIENASHLSENLGSTFTVGHFYDKIFKLKDLMHTKRGKDIALERHNFIIKFLENLQQEVNI